MSLAGISSTSFSQLQSNAAQFQSNPSQNYFRQRSGDLQQLGQSLLEGDLAGAQQAYNAITQLASSAPWQNGASTGPFRISQREQDFEAIGKALQSGDLQGAQKAFATLQQDLHPNLRSGSGTSSGSAQPVSNTIAEIIVNLSNAGSNLLAPSATSNPAITGSATSPATTVTTPAAAAGSGSTASTPSASSSPEIVLNLGTSGGNSVPEIIINLSQGGSGSSAPELAINLGGSSNGSTPEITLNLNNGNGGSGNGSNGSGLELVFTPGPGGPATQSGGLQIDIVA